MAFEAPVFSIPGLSAAADLSTKQFYAVKITAGVDGNVSLCSLAGEKVIGVLQNKPVSGAEAEVMGIGVTKVVAHETLAAGDCWGAFSDGTAQVINDTNTGADLRSYAAGTVIKGAAAGELATVTLGFGTFKVPA